MHRILVAMGNNCNVYRNYRNYRANTDLTDDAQRPQEIEFLLLWATTKSNMADILNIEKNSID